MLGDHEPMRSVTLWASGRPLAPSPAAARTKGRPGAGVVPAAGVNVLVFTGGTVTPFTKVTSTEERWVVKPSRMEASTSSVRAPSTNRSVGSVNVNGAV